MLNIKEQSHVTTHEAIEAIRGLIRKYKPVLEKVLEIKAQVTEDSEELFRGRKENTDVLLQLMKTLQTLENKIIEIDQKLGDHQHTVQSRKKP